VANLCDKRPSFKWHTQTSFTQEGLSDLVEEDTWKHIGWRIDWRQYQREKDVKGEKQIKKKRGLDAFATSDCRHVVSLK